MDFLGIGPWELVLVFLIGFLVLGPKRFPQITKTIGKGMQEFKKASFDLTRQLTSEIEPEEKKPAHSKESKETKVEP